MLLEGRFGAWEKDLIEEFITYPEVSILAFTDARTAIPMVSSRSQEYMMAINTEYGVWVLSLPVPLYADIAKYVEKNIIEPQ